MPEYPRQTPNQPDLQEKTPAVRTGHTILAPRKEPTSKGRTKPKSSDGGRDGLASGGGREGRYESRMRRSEEVNDALVGAQAPRAAGGSYFSGFDPILAGVLVRRSTGLRLLH